MDDVITADDVARLLTLVAPGFFAYTGYTYRFPPTQGRDEFPVFVTSVALSLPLAAVARGIADLLGISTRPTHLAYAALLLVLPLVLGYVAALIRDAARVRRFLATLSLSSD